MATREDILKLKSNQLGLAEAFKAIVDNQAEYNQKVENEILDRKARELQHSQNGGGGVVQLEEYSSNTGNRYYDVAQAITDLAVKSDKGDPVATNLYKKLWEKAVLEIKAHPERQYTVFACPSCRKGITPDSIRDANGCCPYCNLNLDEQKMRGLEI